MKQDVSSWGTIGINRKKPFKVMVCAVTLVAFLFNIISYDLAWAVGTPSVLTHVGPDRADSPGLVKDLSVDTFNLPAYLGYIRDLHKGLSPKGTVPIVIHIQDAHCNYAAQNTISNIIEYLNREYGITQINLEGGEGEYDFSPFNKVQDPNIKRKVADYFLKEGEINGAEYFAINNPDKVALFGVEDTDLYLDNLNVYRGSLKYKGDIDKSLKTLSNYIANLKVRLYSKELLALDQKGIDFKAKALEFKDYVEYLVGLSKGWGIDISDLKNLDILNKTLSLEKGIDFKKSNLERDQLIDRLNKSLSKNELTELVGKAFEFKSGHLQPIEFYSYLIGKAKEVNIDIAEYKDLTLYIGYVSLYATLKKEEITKEIEALEDRIKEKLYQNDAQRELNKLSGHFNIIKNILSITLTQEEFKYYKAHEDEFAIDNFINFIKAHSQKNGLNLPLNGDLKNLDSHLKEMERFYALSYKRDEEFVRNLKGLSLKGTAPEAAILITGGFHTENLTNLLKKKGISYISIMPNFGLDDTECPYFKLLAGNNSALIKFIMANVSSIAIYTYFSPYSKKVYGVDSATLMDDVLKAIQELEAGKDANIGNIHLTLSEEGEPIQGATFNGKQVHAVGRGIKPAAEPPQGVLLGGTSPTPSERGRAQQISETINSVLTYGLLSSKEIEKRGIKVIRSADEKLGVDTGAIVTIQEIEDKRTFVKNLAGGKKGRILDLGDGTEIDTSEYEKTFEKMLLKQVAYLLEGEGDKDPIGVIGERGTMASGKYGAGLASELEVYGRGIVEERLKSGVMVLMKTEETLASLRDRSSGNFTNMQYIHIYGFNELKPDLIEAIFVPEGLFDIVRNSVPIDIRKKIIKVTGEAPPEREGGLYGMSYVRGLGLKIPNWHKAVYDYLSRTELNKTYMMHGVRLPTTSEIAGTVAQPPAVTATLITQATRERYGHLSKWGLGWVAAVTEFFQSLAPISFIRAHGEKQTVGELIPRIIGIVGIWVAMLGAPFIIGTALAGHTDISMTIVFILSLAAGSAGNVLLHGIYNSLANLFHFAPLTLNNEQKSLFDKAYLDGDALLPQMLDDRINEIRRRFADDVIGMNGLSSKGVTLLKGYNLNGNQAYLVELTNISLPFANIIVIVNKKTGNITNIYIGRPVTVGWQVALYRALKNKESLPNLEGEDFIELNKGLDIAGKEFASQLKDKIMELLIGGRQIEELAIKTKKEGAQSTRWDWQVLTAPEKFTLLRGIAREMRRSESIAKAIRHLLRLPAARGFGITKEVLFLKAKDVEEGHYRHASKLIFMHVKGKSISGEVFIHELAHHIFEQLDKLDPDKRLKIEQYFGRKFNAMQALLEKFLCYRGHLLTFRLYKLIEDMGGEKRELYQKLTGLIDEVFAYTLAALITNTKTYFPISKADMDFLKDLGLLPEDFTSEIIDDSKEISEEEFMEFISYESLYDKLASIFEPIINQNNKDEEAREAEKLFQEMIGPLIEYNKDLILIKQPPQLEIQEQPKYQGLSPQIREIIEQDLKAEISPLAQNPPQLLLEKINQDIQPQIIHSDIQEPIGQEPMQEIQPEKDKYDNAVAVAEIKRISGPRVIKNLASDIVDFFKLYFEAFFVMVMPLILAFGLLYYMGVASKYDGTTTISHGTAIVDQTAKNIYESPKPRESPAHRVPTSEKLERIIEEFEGSDPDTHQPSSWTENAGFGNSLVPYMEIIVARISGDLTREMFFTGIFNAVGDNGKFTKAGDISVEPSGNETYRKVHLTVILAPMKKGKRIRMFNILNGKVIPENFADGRLSINQNGLLVANDDIDKPVEITYTIIKMTKNSIVRASQPITPWMKKEFENIPLTIRDELDKVRGLSEEERAEAVRIVLGRYFIYTTHQNVRLMKGTWGEFLDSVLKQYGQFASDCDVLSMYAFIFSRYLGLETVFLIGFNNAGYDPFLLSKYEAHGLLGMKINGEWVIFEPSGYAGKTEGIEIEDVFKDEITRVASDGSLIIKIDKIRDILERNGIYVTDELLNQIIRILMRHKAIEDEQLSKDKDRWHAHNEAMSIYYADQSIRNNQLLRDTMDILIPCMRCTRELIHQPAVRAWENFIAAVAYPALGITIGASLLMNDLLFPCLFGLIHWYSMASLAILFTQGFVALHHAGLTGRAATPDDTREEIFDKFGPIIGPLVIVHEAIHRFTAKRGIQKLGKASRFIDEGFAYGVEYLAAPLLVIWYGVRRFGAQISTRPVSHEETLGLKQEPQIRWVIDGEIAAEDYEILKRGEILNIEKILNENRLREKAPKRIIVLITPKVKVAGAKIIYREEYENLSGKIGKEKINIGDGLITLPSNAAGWDHKKKKAILGHELGHLAHPEPPKIRKHRMDLLDITEDNFETITFIELLSDSRDAKDILRAGYLEEMNNYLDYRMKDHEDAFKSDQVKTLPKDIIARQFLYGYVLQVLPFELAGGAEDVYLEERNEYLRKLESIFAPYLDEKIRQDVIRVIQEDLVLLLQKELFYPSIDELNKIIAKVKDMVASQGRVVAGSKGEESLGRVIDDVIGFKNFSKAKPFYFGSKDAENPEGRYKVEDGKIKMGDLEIKVKEFSEMKDIKENVIEDDGVVVKTKDGKFFILIRAGPDVSEERMKEALHHELIAYISIQGGVTAEDEIEEIHRMAKDASLAILPKDEIARIEETKPLGTNQGLIVAVEKARVTKAVERGFEHKQTQIKDLVDNAIRGNKYEIAQVGEAIALLQKLGKEHDDTHFLERANRLKDRRVVLIQPPKDIAVLDVEWDDSFEGGIKWQASYLDEENNGIYMAKKTLDELTVNQLAALLNEVEGGDEKEGKFIIGNTTPKDEVPIYLYDKLDFLALESLSKKEFSVSKKYFENPYSASDELIRFVKDAIKGVTAALEKANAILNAFIKMGVTYSSNVPGDRNAAQIFRDLLNNGKHAALACHEFTILMVTALRIAGLLASYGLVNYHRYGVYHAVALWQDEKDKKHKIELFDISQLLSPRNLTYSIETLKDQGATAMQMHQKAHNLPLGYERIKTRRIVAAVMPHVPEAVLVLGVDLYELGEYGEALLYFKKALELEPNMVDAWINMAQIYLQKDILDKAREYFQKALSVNDKIASARSGLGVVFAKEKKPQEAIKEFLEAIKIDETKITPYAYRVMGDCYRETKEFKEAIYYYRKALHKAPGDIAAQEQLQKLIPYVYSFVANEELVGFVNNAIKGAKTDEDKAEAVVKAMNRIGIINRDPKFRGENNPLTAVNIFSRRIEDGENKGIVTDRYEAGILYVTLLRLAGIMAEPALIRSGDSFKDYKVYAYARGTEARARETPLQSSRVKREEVGIYFKSPDIFEVSESHIISEEEFIALYYVNVGDYLQELGRVAQARESYQTALKIYPKLKEAEDALAGAEKSPPDEPVTIVAGKEGEDVNLDAGTARGVQKSKPVSYQAVKSWIDGLKVPRQSLTSVLHGVPIIMDFPLGAGDIYVEESGIPPTKTYWVMEKPIMGEVEPRKCAGLHEAIEIRNKMLGGIKSFPLSNDRLKELLQNVIDSPQFSTYFRKIGDADDFFHGHLIFLGEEPYILYHTQEFEESTFALPKRNILQKVNDPTYIIDPIEKGVHPTSGMRGSVVSSQLDELGLGRNKYMDGEIGEEPFSVNIEFFRGDEEVVGPSIIKLNYKGKAVSLAWTLDKISFGLKEKEPDEEEPTQIEDRESPVAWVVLVIDGFIIMTKTTSKEGQDKEFLKEAEDLKKQLESITDFNSALNILREYSVNPTPLQNELLAAVSSVTPGFNKRTVLFIEPSSPLAHIFSFGQRNVLFVGMERGQGSTGFSLVNRNLADPLELLFRLTYEEWRKTDGLIKEENSLSTYLSEGITTYLAKRSVKEILSHKPKIVEFIKSQNKDFTLENFDEAITPYLDYKNELQFAEMLIRDFGESFVTNLYAKGDLNLLKEKMGDKFDIIAYVAGMIQSPLNYHIIRGMIPIIFEDSSFDGKKLLAFWKTFNLVRKTIIKYYDEKGKELPPLGDFIKEITDNPDFYNVMSTYTTLLANKETPADSGFKTRLANSISGIITKSAGIGRIVASSKGEDINLAAGMLQPVQHSVANTYIRENLPQDLRGNPANIKNYKEYEGFGVKARIVPITGLLEATRQFAHIGLGQVYGEPVIYIDEDYAENQTVIDHELYEISKWEAKRKELKLEPHQMRQWILDNYDEARALADEWHRKAPSLNSLFIDLLKSAGVEVKELAERMSYYVREDGIFVIIASASMTEKLVAMKVAGKATRAKYLLEKVDIPELKPDDRVVILNIDTKRPLSEEVLPHEIRHHKHDERMVKDPKANDKMHAVLKVVDILHFDVGLKKSMPELSELRGEIEDRIYGAIILGEDEIAVDELIPFDEAIDMYKLLKDIVENKDKEPAILEQLQQKLREMVLAARKERLDRQRALEGIEDIYPEERDLNLAAGIPATEVESLYWVKEFIDKVNSIEHEKAIELTARIIKAIEQHDARLRYDLIVALGKDEPIKEVISYVERGQLDKSEFTKAVREVLSTEDRYADVSDVAAAAGESYIKGLTKPTPHLSDKDKPNRFRYLLHRISLQTTDLAKEAEVLKTSIISASLVDEKRIAYSDFGPTGFIVEPHSYDSIIYAHLDGRGMNGLKQVNYPFYINGLKVIKKYAGIPDADDILEKTSQDRYNEVLIEGSETKGVFIQPFAEKLYPGAVSDIIEFAIRNGLDIVVLPREGPSYDNTNKFVERQMKERFKSLTAQPALPMTQPEPASQQREAARKVLDTVRFPGEPRIFFVPIEGYDVFKAHLERVKSETKHELKDFKITMIYYDGTEKGLREAYDRAKTELKESGALALAYIKDGQYEMAQEIFKDDNRVKYIQERLEHGYNIKDIALHVVLGLGILDFVRTESLKNGSLDKYDIWKLLNLLETMGDAESNKAMIDQLRGLDAAKKVYELIFSRLFFFIPKAERVDINNIPKMIERELEFLRSL